MGLSVGGSAEESLGSAVGTTTSGAVVSLAVGVVVVGLMGAAVGAAGVVVIAGSGGTGAIVVGGVVSPVRPGGGEPSIPVEGPWDGEDFMGVVVYSVGLPVGVAAEAELSVEGVAGEAESSVIVAESSVIVVVVGGGGPKVGPRVGNNVGRGKVGAKVGSAVGFEEGSVVVKIGIRDGFEVGRLVGLGDGRAEDGIIIGMVEGGVGGTKEINGGEDGANEGNDVDGSSVVGARLGLTVGETVMGDDSSACVE